MYRIQKRYRMTEKEFSGAAFSRDHTEHITTGYVLLAATRASIGRLISNRSKTPQLAKCLSLLGLSYSSTRKAIDQATVSSIC